MAQWREQFKQQRVMYQQTFLKHWSNKISSCGGDSKKLWSRLRCLLSTFDQDDCCRSLSWRLRTTFRHEDSPHPSVNHYLSQPGTLTYQLRTPQSPVLSTALHLQRPIADVADWCTSQRLNAAKTELMWFGSLSSLHTLSQSTRTVTVSTKVLQPAKSVEGRLVMVAGICRRL